MVQGGTKLRPSVDAQVGGAKASRHLELCECPLKIEHREKYSNSAEITCTVCSVFY